LAAHGSRTLSKKNGPKVRERLTTCNLSRCWNRYRADGRQGDALLHAA
jgi:hypothetical protein